MNEPQIDPSTPHADVAEFVAVIRHALGHVASINHGPSGGYEFIWSHKGLWKITVGAVLAAEPALEGPRGYLRLARCDHWHAQLALVILGAIDGLPDGVEPPRINQDQGPQPAVGRVYGTAEAPLVRPAAPRPAYREPGGNTGVRPGPAWNRPSPRPAAGGRVFATDGDQSFHGGRLVDDVPPAGVGPGASYAPQRVDPGPAPARPDCEPTSTIAGSDLWPGTAGVDDTGRTAPAPANYEPTPAPAYEPGPSPSCATSE